MMKLLGTLNLLAVFLATPFFLSTANAALQVANAAPHSDYAWLPDYKRLFLRAGANLFSSASNFDNAGNLANLTGNAELTRNYFFIQPEYGLAQDWSMKAQLGLISSTVTNGSGAAALSSSGFGDMNFSLKWMVKPFDPLLSFEAVFVLPTAQAVPATRTDVALGDGSFDAGIKLHTAHESGSFALGFSPGFIYRNKGYSPLVTGDAFVQFDFRRGYLRGYGNLVFPLTTVPLFDSSITKHDANGSAGSYALLSASPFGFSAGAKLGIKIVDELFVEAWFARSFAGQRYPNFNQFGFGLFYAIDFLEVLPVKNLREVPFDGDEGNFYKGK